MILLRGRPPGSVAGEPNITERNEGAEDVFRTQPDINKTPIILYPFR